MKSLILWCAAAAWLLGNTGRTQAGVIFGPEVNPANGHEYYLLSQQSWADAEAFAVGLGGHLVTINDAAENAWVIDKFTPTTGGASIWIGLNDVSTEGTFAWLSGQPVTYLNWHGGEPNNSGGNENAVHLYPDGTWNDARATLTDIYAVAEVQSVSAVPEPASLILAGVGLVALCGYGWRRKQLLMPANEGT